jgi:hypothetical protein
MTVGVIATHEEYPIERMKLDRRLKWLGSVSHDECIKLTDVEDLFEESDDEEEEAQGEDDEMEEAEKDSDEDMEPQQQSKKQKRKQGTMGELGRSQAKDDDGFYADL